MISIAPGKRIQSSTQCHMLQSVQRTSGIDCTCFCYNWNMVLAHAQTSPIYESTVLVNSGLNACRLKFETIMFGNRKNC